MKARYFLKLQRYEGDVRDNLPLVSVELPITWMKLKVIEDREVLEQAAHDTLNDLLEEMHRIQGQGDEHTNLR